MKATGRQRPEHVPARFGQRHVAGTALRSPTSLASVIDLAAALRGRPYPGRGLIVGRLTSGVPFVVYFVTGRSVASRARELRARGPIDVEVVDTSGGPVDHLRHYLAVVQRGAWLVVGNGDQVEPIAEALSAGVSAVEAWAAHAFEPDPPIWTPRIWVAWELNRMQAPLLGCARRSERPGGAADRVLWLADVTEPGTGLLMTTYQGTAGEVATSREPVDVVVEEGAGHEVLESVWQVLDPAVRVAALALEFRNEEVVPLFRA